MLSATTDVAKSAQIYPKLPKIAQNCPKTISSKKL
jgi:hypothetical protein